MAEPTSTAFLIVMSLFDVNANASDRADFA